MVEINKCGLVERCSCHDVGDLETALDTVQQTKYNSYKSNTINIINSIEEYIKGN